MGWEHELAAKLKQKNTESKSKAISQSTPFIGTIEQKEPLIISIENGELMYEDAEEEILKTKLFASRDVKKGDSVICIPCDGMDEIIAIDLEG